MFKHLLLIVFLIIPQTVGAQGSLNLPLEKLDAGTFLDLSRNKLLLGVSTPVLTVKRAIEFEIGALKDGDRTLGLGGISVDLKRLVSVLPSNSDVVYALDKAVVLGTFMAFDFDQQELRYGFKLAFRFGE